MEPQTQVWNPDKRLNINAFANNDMFCVGMAVTRGNARCRWRVTGDKHSKVCNLLDKIGKEEPMEIFNSNDLLRLAKLSLCEERHQYQVYDIVGRWNNVIQNITEEYTEIKRNSPNHDAEPDASTRQDLDQGSALGREPSHDTRKLQILTDIIKPQLSGAILVLARSNARYYPSVLSWFFSIIRHPVP
jgi:hypothetical protein